MWNGKKSPPYAQQLCGFQTVAVAAGDQNVGELRHMLDVAKDGLPPLGDRQEANFAHTIGIYTNTVGACAEAAVDRADGGCYAGELLSARWTVELRETHRERELCPGSDGQDPGQVNRWSHLMSRDGVVGGQDEAESRVG